jgi:murein DD-endopeptidase MepM/ murein hydrolase activator NlpD
MNRRAAALLLVLLAPAASADEITRRFGQLTVAVDTGHAYPGGIAVVRFRPPWASGFVIFEGRRAPVFAAPGGPRALVPIPVSNPGGGTGLLGIEIYARRGRQRLRMEFPIAARAFGERGQTLSDEKRALLLKPAGLRDGRRLMQALRTLSSDALWRGPFRPPAAPPPLETFGGRESYDSGSPVETMMDGGLGNQHRGLDYPLAPGSSVLAPAAGAVVLAETLLLTGNSVVIDHGQGLVSLLCHLGGPPEVRAGDRIDAGMRVGVSGDSGIATFSHVHWGVYLYGIAVDPNVVLKLIE